MLTLYRSNDLNSLARKLLDDLSGRKEANLLQPDHIIIQNNKMKRWLQKFIARERGISANIKAEFPGDFAWEMYRRISPSLPDMLPSEREPMQFSIFDILQSGKRRKQLRPLHRYIQSDIAGEAAERAWSLSGHIADLFDRYQIYRPLMILRWQEGELRTKKQDEKWQATLWQMLCERWDKQLKGLKWKSRAELHTALIKGIKSKSISVDGLPESVHIFGVAQPAPAFLEIFIQLSRFVDIRFYWLDVIQTENSLTKSWGETGREFIELFESLSDTEEIEREIISISPQQKPAFDRVLMNARSNEKKFIQIHSCHGPVREAEVLYDQLLAIFDEDAALHPEDVLIITPDIETYAPAIEAVFGSHHLGQPPIPYHVSDYYGAADSSSRAFIKLLELSESRFKVTEVLDLLGMKPVRRAFDITEDETARLERWIEENNIRWGIDASFKERTGLPASEHFTWQSGLNRMMLGTVMEWDGEHLLNGIFPYAEIAGSENTMLTGKLSRFLHQLFELNKKVRQPKPLHEWAGIFQQAVQTFLATDLLSGDELTGLAAAIEKLLKQQHASGIERNVPFKIAYVWLRNKLEKNARSGSSSGRGVTFSSMIAARSIPYKMIGMIGMNDDSFPRRDIPLSYDLMKTESKQGDPDQLKEDRYLFLEALESAKKYCYISYTGQSNLEDADFPPSVLVSELTDYLLEEYQIKPDEIVQKHPLQGFSIDYFNESGKFTYSGNRHKIARKLLETQAEKKTWLGLSLSTQTEDDKKISVTDLISYFQHPAKFVLENRLGLFIRDEKIIENDAEPFNLKGLGRYSVKQDLLAEYLENQSLAGFEKVLNARDCLPEGWAGEQAFSQAANDAEVFGRRVLEKQGESLMEDVEIDIETVGFKLTGTISGYHPPLFMDYYFSKRKPKYFASWWIKHVILNASGHPSPDVKSVLLTWEDGQLGEDYLPPLEDAKEILTDLLQNYWHGQSAVSFFFPASSFAFVNDLLKNGNQERALNAANRKWQKNRFQGPPGESEDRYVKWIVGNENPLEHAAFKEEAVRFWKPFFNIFKQDKK